MKVLACGKVLPVIFGSPPSIKTTSFFLKSKPYLADVPPRLNSCQKPHESTMLCMPSSWTSRIDACPCRQSGRSRRKPSFTGSGPYTLGTMYGRPAAAAALTSLLCVPSGTKTESVMTRTSWPFIAAVRDSSES